MKTKNKKKLKMQENNYFGLFERKHTNVKDKKQNHQNQKSDEKKKHLLHFHKQLFFMKI